MSKKKTTEEFIEEIKKIHGNKYDYSKINYVNNKTKVCIVCPKHGEFWQRPDKIINRHDGCEKCSYEYRSSIFRKKQDDFIKDAVKIHGNKYDYSKTFYHKSSDKICIICPKHGEFWQIANDHIRGSGCPVCKQSNLEKEIINRLNIEDIKYIYQCGHDIFSWLGRQTLDFYLPDYNIAIECQGRQHFQPIEHFGGKLGLKACIERDKNKKMLCDKNGIKLKYYATDFRIIRDNTFFDDIDELLNNIKNE